VNTCHVSTLSRFQSDMVLLSAEMLVPGKTSSAKLSSDTNRSNTGVPELLSQYRPSSPSSTVPSLSESLAGPAPTNSAAVTPASAATGTASIRLSFIVQPPHGGVTGGREPSCYLAITLCSREGSFLDGRPPADYTPSRQQLSE